MIKVNSTFISVIDLYYAGFSQKFLFSPILYFFFNIDLIKSKINKNQESIVFIDNYLAWIIWNSIEHNIKLFQDMTILYFLSLAKISDVIFQTKKTYFIHFTKINST